jgi:hypothetical protein
MFSSLVKEASKLISKDKYDEVNKLVAEYEYDPSNETLMEIITLSANVFDMCSKISESLKEKLSNGISAESYEFSRCFIDGCNTIMDTIFDKCEEYRTTDFANSLAYEIWDMIKEDLGFSKFEYENMNSTERYYGFLGDILEWFSSNGVDNGISFSLNDAVKLYIYMLYH